MRPKEGGKPMKINKLMQKDLITCSPSATVHDVAELMRDHSVGSVLIVADGGNLKGIVTDRDIALNVAADSKDPQTTHIDEVMSTNPVTIDFDADVESALKTMSGENIRRLPVTQNGRVVGLLSSADVAVEIKEEIDQLIGLEQAFSKLA
jgi:CBS domain-containing protein